VDRVAHYLSSVGLIVPRAEPDTLAIDLPRSPVIAVLVSSSVDETILELALAKAGFVSLLLSVNNSAAAIAHLCKTTGSKQLIYGPKFEDTAREAQRTCQAGGGELKLLLDKRFPLWGKGGIEHAHVEPFKAVYTPTQEKGRPVVILHSSGSV
jgi:acyl-CoA synthetase (AMP-forming)/AMP-acid ligase II